MSEIENIYTTVRQYKLLISVIEYLKEKNEYLGKKELFWFLFSYQKCINAYFSKYEDETIPFVEFNEFEREFKKQLPLARFSKAVATVLGKAKKKIGLKF